jgi:hypothetical protein
VFRPLLLGSVAIALSGCGGEKGALDTASDQTREIKSYRHAFAVEGDINGQPIQTRGEGTSSADATRGRFTASVVEGDEPPLEFEAVVIDERIYMRVPSLVSSLPKGKEWVRMSGDTLPTSILSPVALVEYVNASDATEHLGSEAVRGQATTHFRAPLDLRAMAASSGPDVVERMRNLGGTSQLSGTVEVWLADDGRPARVAAELKPGELSGSVRVTSEVLAYDVPVDATEPPPAIVATESEVAQGG